MVPSENGQLAMRPCASMGMLIEGPKALARSKMANAEKAIVVFSKVISHSLIQKERIVNAQTLDWTQEMRHPLGYGR